MVRIKFVIDSYLKLQTVRVIFKTYLTAFLFLQIILFHYHSNFYSKTLKGKVYKNGDWTIAIIPIDISILCIAPHFSFYNFGAFMREKIECKGNPNVQNWYGQFLLWSFWENYFFNLSKVKMHFYPFSYRLINQTIGLLRHKILELMADKLPFFTPCTSYTFDCY